MATLVLSAIGAATGAQLGGAALGLSGAVLGRAVGATVGRVIDQRLLGLGSRAVDHTGIDRLRITGAGEGLPLPRIWGRMRVAGHIIWASNFEEHRGRSRRTKGGLGPRVNEQARYSVNLAIALCEGEILGIGRVWADGEEIAPDDLNIRVYTGSEDQLPDPKIEAIEGVGCAPAYRGTAYVMMEDLDLGQFGNRIPGFSFEVLRTAQGADQTTLQDAIRAVAWMPGSGEFALSTSPVDQHSGLGERQMMNVNSPMGGTDFAASLKALQTELPKVSSGLLVVSWFGGDLRCAECEIRPKVETPSRPASEAWSVSGLSRSAAAPLALIDGAPVYGGTPSDASVLQAISAMKDAGQKVVFYPFILMDQLAGNSLPNPWTGIIGQPSLPWRGRITLSAAPGRPGTPDRTAAATAEVAAFFGTVGPQHFTVHPGKVIYSGPPEWSYRRFILHCAALCAASGGVDAFCVGSEMRALTQIRGAGDSFPAVDEMIALTRDVRTLLGPEVKLTYAADWSEYFGYRDTAGNRYFHLDPLWADPEIDFIGIDNYMPLSDWRDDAAHLDGADWSTIYDLDYLKSNVAGGEGFDWFYPSVSARDAQDRSPITDGAHDEPWIWRYKDLRAWWENPHHDRLDDVRAAQPTLWQPRSKADLVHRNRLRRDRQGHEPAQQVSRPEILGIAPAIPFQRPARRSHSDAVSPRAGRVLDRSRATTRCRQSTEGGWSIGTVPMSGPGTHGPFPGFPAAATSGPTATTGRGALDHGPRHEPAACRRGGRNLRGVRGSRLRCQPPFRRGARLCRALHATGAGDASAPDAGLWVRGDREVRQARVPDARRPRGSASYRRRPGRARRRRSGNDPRVRTRSAGPRPADLRRGRGRFRYAHTETVLPDHDESDVQHSELPLLMTRGEARQTVGRWMAEARVARDVARFSLAPSSPVRAGDVVGLETPEGLRHYRVDRMEMTGAREIEAVRVEPGLYRGGAPRRSRCRCAPMPRPHPCSRCFWICR
jgi:hypothetical protein